MSIRDEIRRIHAIVVKEVLQLKRDPLRLRMMIFPPILQVLLLGFAVNMDVKDIPLLVQDQDQSVESRELVTRFVASGYFKLKGYESDARRIDARLNRGDVAVALVIPRGFSEKLARRQPAPVQAVVDGSDASFASRSVSYAAMIISQYSGDVLMQRMDRMGRTFEPIGAEARVRVWFNPELNSRWFLIPGLLALVLLILTMVGTAMNIVREKEIGTMEQLVVTPIRPYQLILGKLIPNAIVGAIVALAVIVTVKSAFDIPLKGSPVLLFSLTMLFLISQQVLGLFVSTVSKTQQQAMLAGVFFVMLPMLLLSGFVFPIENMPVPIQAVTYIIPLRYFFGIVRGIFLKGVGMEFLWDETLALVAFTVVVLWLSVMRFSKRLG